MTAIPQTENRRIDNELSLNRPAPAQKRRYLVLITRDCKGERRLAVLHLRVDLRSVCPVLPVVSQSLPYPDLKSGLVTPSARSTGRPSHCRRSAFSSASGSASLRRRRTSSALCPEQLDSSRSG